jgi:ribosomal protein S6
MEDFSAKDVVVKKEKEYSESETERSGSDNEENVIVIEPTKAVLYDDAKMKLMKKYSEIVSKKINFGGTQGSWYTLKFYTMKETSAAKYYLVEMEFSNDPMKQLNIWLKATFIHDVLKCLSMDDKDAKSLFNGFEKVIAAGELAEICLEPNGANTCRSNTSNG